MKYILYKFTEGDSWIKFYPQIKSKIQLNQHIFKELWLEKPTEPHQIIMFGKLINSPRLQKNFGKDYKFSGTKIKAFKIKHNYLKNILKYVKKKFKHNFNQMLINYYRNGNDYIGKHSDDEKQKIKNTPILSFSFGATRKFNIYSKKTKQKILTLELPNNSLIVMGGQLQIFYKHGIPKQPKINEKRINITFRSFI